MSMSLEAPKTLKDLTSEFDKVKIDHKIFYTQTVCVCDRIRLWSLCWVFWKERSCGLDETPTRRCHCHHAWSLGTKALFIRMQVMCLQLQWSVLTLHESKKCTCTWDIFFPSCLIIIVCSSWCFLVGKSTQCYHHDYAMMTYYIM